jgi:hypothetical protein
VGADPPGGGVLAGADAKGESSMCAAREPWYWSSSPLAQPGIRPTVSMPAKKTADESQNFHELNDGCTGHFLI